MSKKITRKGSLSKTDEFGNFYRQTITGGSDAVAFAQWQTGYSIADLICFVIHKIRWRPNPTAVGYPNAQSDRMTFALTSREDLSGLDLEAAVQDSVLASGSRQLILASAVGQALVDPDITVDFTNEPGGGRLIAPRPLFFASYGQGLGGALVYNVEICYTMVSVTDALYRELWQSMNPSA